VEEAREEGLMMGKFGGRAEGEEGLEGEKGELEVEGGVDGEVEVGGRMPERGGGEREVEVGREEGGVA
jgi:hypothetical protein